MNGAGWTGLHAGRFLPDGHAVNAQRTFIDAVVFRVEARHVERAASDTVAAADTLLGLEVDNTVSVLNDRPFRRTGLQAARIGAVHTAILTDQPLQFVVLFHFREAHHRPDFAVKSAGLSYTPTLLPTSSRMSFHSEHAT